jgi:hypothetical protein
MTGAKTCHQPDTPTSSFVQRIIDDATTWIPREDKKASNQPHPFNKELPLAGVINELSSLQTGHDLGDKQKRGEFLI